ncbi:MAG: AsmA family protein [Spirochaetota bacterium]|jgi:hypothetical protein|nr:AsmA family protein [Spirochaetota bacterium]
MNPDDLTPATGAKKTETTNEIYPAKQRNTQFSFRKLLQHKPFLRKAFPLKFFLFGLAALLAGILIFALAPGNEPLTFLGFALVLGGVLVPLIILARRILRKVYLWIPAAILIFIIVLPLTLIAYITFFFPNEIVRQILQTELSKELARPVSIGHLKISILKGITLNDLIINDRGSEELFVRAGLNLSYELFPIFIGQLRVHKAILESPTIHLRRDFRDGQAVMNVDDLLAPGEDTPEEPEEDSGLPELPFFLSVGEVGIENGSVIFMDRGDPELANEYILGNLNCLISDVTWPIVEPLGIRFNFRISMRQLDVEDGKTFTLAPGLTGRIMLRAQNGDLVPEGRIDFFAQDGEFYGQQFLTDAQGLVEEMKLGFFDGIKNASIGNLDEFENALTSKTASLASGAAGKIDALVNGANKDFTSLMDSLEKSKLLALGDFDKGAQKENDDIKSESDSLLNNIQTSYSRIMRLYPAASSKLQIDSYTQRAQAKVENVQTGYAAFAKTQAEGLQTDVNAFIEAEQKRHTDYIAALQGGLDQSVEKYAASIRAQFQKQLGRAEDFVDSYDLSIPFLHKRMSFDHVSTILTITNGVMRLRGLKITSKEFSVDGNGDYNLVNDDFDAAAKLILDKRFASNTILSLFLNSDGAPELDFEVKTVNGKFSFKLLGDPIPKRMSNIAAAKAKEFMHSYLDRYATSDSFLANLRSGGFGESLDPKSAIASLQQRRLSLLTSQKAAQRQSLLNEGKDIAKKIEEDALKAIAGGGIPNIPIKKPF